MEKLYNGWTLELSPSSFPVSTDSMVLADFVRLGRSAQVLDLGAGCGTLGLLLCAAHPDCSVTGVEIDPGAHEAALANSRHNGLGSRLTSICADLCGIPGFLSAGAFSCCVSNPPYFSDGRRHRTYPSARREECCPLDALFASAAWALRSGGDFFLVHRPERLASVFYRAAQAGLEPKRLRLVRHQAGGGVTLVLIQCRKGAKPGLKWEELCLLDEAGRPTEDYRRIYHC